MAIAAAKKPTTTPRVSVNKLGEYMGANPARRKKIIYDAKYPSSFIVARYKEAREIIQRYYAAGCDVKIIERAVKEFEKRKPATDWQESDLAGSLEAMEAILLCDDMPDLGSFTVTANNDSSALISINGVDISINPDLIIRGTSKGKLIVGAVKFHLIKTNPIEDESGKTIATLLKYYLDKKVISKKEIAALEYCISLDVFTQNITSAPSSYARRMTYIEAACEEIKLWWATL